MDAKTKRSLWKIVNKNLDFLDKHCTFSKGGDLLKSDISKKTVHQMAHRLWNQGILDGTFGLDNYKSYRHASAFDLYFSLKRIKDGFSDGTYHFDGSYSLTNWASDQSIAKVLKRAAEHHIDPVGDFGPTDAIMTLGDAYSLRSDEFDTVSSYPKSQDYSDICNDLVNLKDWKQRGIKYVYIDDDIYTTNGRCCLVSKQNVKDVNNWLTDYIKKQNA